MSKTKGNTRSTVEDFGKLGPNLKKTKVTPPVNSKKTSKGAPAPTQSSFNQSFLTKFISVKRQFSLGTGVTDTDKLLICSWNINGLRAITNRNDLQSYFEKRKPDILCLSETKTTQESIDTEKLLKWVPPEYTSYFNCSTARLGYSGTAIITKYKPLAVEYGMGFQKYDAEGRIITAEFEKFILISCYVPMCGDDFSKLDTRINEWDANFHAYLAKMREKGKPVIVCGDLNVVNQDIDVWGDMGKFAGSSDQERKNFVKLLDSGFIDSFRFLHPDVRKYSWWSTYLSHRPVNKGRRYDYILVTKDGLKGIKEAFINNDAFGSDHCPVEMIYNPNFDLQLEDHTKEEEAEIVVQTTATQMSIEKIEVQKESADDQKLVKSQAEITVSND